MTQFAYTVIYNSMDAAERVIASSICNAITVDMCSIDVMGAVRAGNWSAFGQVITPVFLVLSPVSGLVADDFIHSPYDCVYLPGMGSSEMLAPTPAFLNTPRSASDDNNAAVVAHRCDICEWHPPAIPAAIGCGGGLQMLTIAVLYKGEMTPTAATPSVEDARAFMYELASYGDAAAQMRACDEIRDSISGCDRIIEMTSLGKGRLAERDRVISAFVGNGAVFPHTAAYYIAEIKSLAESRGVSVSFAEAAGL